MVKVLLVGREYRHYKGGVYVCLGRALLESTGEVMVIYEGLDKAIWVRPEAEFLAKFELLA